MDANTIATIILIGSFFVLIALRFPIAFALGVSSVLCCAYIGRPITMVAQNIVRGINTFSLMAVPFFIIAGEVMGAGGISDRLIKLADACVGWMRGGLAIVNCLDSTFFGGISGSSAADTASLGPIVIPMMTKQGYPLEFATSITIASSVQGILIPPSHNMVIYAMVAGSVSVGALFMAGLVPGVLLGLILAVYCYVQAVRHNYPRGSAFSLKKIFVTLKESILSLFTLLIVVFGVTLGIFTATEAAGFACIWSIFLALVVYREITVKDLWKLLGKAMRTISMVMILIGTSAAFGWLLGFLKVPEMVSNLILGFSTNKVVVLLIINLLLLMFGMLMDMAAIITITTPILLPIAMQVGMDPIHYGAMMLLNLGIGLLTPPVGNTLFIGAAITGMKIEKLAKATIPFYIVMAGMLLLITFCPDLVLTVPRLMGYL
ncbi:MAG: TRAP transporter large permease [Clostridia bacterium]|nr:TRAP transporter large permease [Clostridia bacterium]